MNKSTEKEKWYKDGLRFECSECGDCCTGAPGFVWINNEEIKLIAKILEFDDLEEFEKLYIRKIGIRKSLKEFSNGDCVFFDNDSRKCNVYDGRPRQCRTWPFWDSNLRTEKDWQQTCKECPGSGKGKLHQIGEIEKQRKVVKI